MRTRTVGEEQRRAAREHWWRQVLARPEVTGWNEVLDEVIFLRFRVEDRFVATSAGAECGGPQTTLC